MNDTTRIHVEPEHGETRTIQAADQPGALADLLEKAGMPLNTRCGQRGLCRGCEVILTDGRVLIDQAEVGAPRTVQACRAHPVGEVTIQVPDRSRIEHRPQVGETFEIAVPYAHQPLFTPQPGGRDTAFAVDIGTTTVVVLLVDPITGDILSRAGAFNAQMRFGDNVLTRIEAAREPAKRAELQHAIVAGTIAPLLRKACERAQREPSRIAGAALAGNTTMLHLLVGEDPTPLGMAPFTPRFITGRTTTAAALGLALDGLAPDTPLQLLPGIAAYIGADITAGVFASGMVYDPAPSLLVDIGTNGEIVLQAHGALTACATAAGPAFEGCGLRCGTRARHGAVGGLRLTRQPFAIHAQAIGDVPLATANGICGSAYVDFLATARRSGLLGETGRFTAQAWQNIPPVYQANNDGERALRIVTATGHGALSISEVDVALLLQAKAAIGAGIEILLDHAAVKPADLHRLYLAGGFGMHLDVSHAIAIGLLPGFRPEQVRVVGNTALAGALLALIDRTTLAEMESLRAQVNVVELNLADGFEDCYIEHLMLP